MKPYPISLQLYPLREEAAQDFSGALKTVADRGYVGVEFAGATHPRRSSLSQCCRRTAHTKGPPLWQRNNG